MTVGVASFFATDAITRTNSRGLIPQNTAAKIAAHIAAVPDADAQLKLYIAAYFVGFATTGGMRRIWLCSPGHAMLIERLFNFASTGGYPHVSTNTTSSKYGTHADHICPAV